MPARVDSNQLRPAADQVEDCNCALSDLPVSVQLQFVTFASGGNGEFSYQDWLDMVHLTLAEIEVCNEKAFKFVLLNFACIYKGQRYRLTRWGREKTQIAGGILTSLILP